MAQSERVLPVNAAPPILMNTPIGVYIHSAATNPLQTKDIASTELCCAAYFFKNLPQFIFKSKPLVVL